MIIAAAAIFSTTARRHYAGSDALVRLGLGGIGPTVPTGEEAGGAPVSPQFERIVSVMYDDEAVVAVRTVAGASVNLDRVSLPFLRSNPASALRTVAAILNV